MRLILVLFALLVTSAPALAERTILVMGDSLSAGYGIRPEEAWPALLATRLNEKRLDYSVANLSVSGETTAGGRTRLPEALVRYRPAVVIIALGANDGLRGLPVAQMRDNLNAMTVAAQSAGARVVIAGMRLPPNYGPYAADFQEIYGYVARARKAVLVPFLLEPVAVQRTYFQSDNLHPTAEAQPLLLDHLWLALHPLLK